MKNIPETFELRFAKNHKSITSLQTTKLPSFCVLTGPNGSGKTHLLEAISNESVSVFDDNEKIIPKREIRYLEMGQVVPVNTVEHNASAFRSNHWSMAQIFENEFIQNVRRNSLAEIIGRQKIEGERANDLLNAAIPSQCAFVDTELTKENREYFYNQLNDRLASFRNFTLQRWSDPRNYALVQTLADELGSHLFLKEQSYITDALERISISSGSLFFDLAAVISTYHRDSETNIYNRYRVEHQNRTDLAALSELEFENVYGPKPWTLINEFMTSE